jgi:DNA mismatch repair protein MutS
VAELDVLLGFAERAHRRGWVRPVMTEAPVLDIAQGRHPVLEQTLGSNFVPNDVKLGVSGDSGAPVALITGPNMAGKSTFIRQTALLVLLAHAGSFVPAQAATIGITDRIFTRIGADDALHAGQSTFMVEMIETANILHHATGRSLVVLDEIGRGTSTLDGLSLAWGIAEHLARASDGATERRSDEGAGESSRADSDPSVASSLRRSVASPRTLFATHYHELTELADLYPGKVQNLHVEVREWPPGDPAAQIIFLHRISPGRTDQSYGIHVARLAGLPARVIERAREVLKSLAVEHTSAEMRVARGEAAAVMAESKATAGKKGGQAPPQMSLFTEHLRHPALDRLAEMKIEQLSPIQAFDTLRELKRLLDEE